MIKTIVLTVFLVFQGVEAQHMNSTIYKLETRVKSSWIGTYNVNILILNDDGTYKLLWKSYSSKKMSRIHALLRMKIEKGEYNIHDGVLKLISETENSDLTLKIISKRKLRVLLEDNTLSDLAWRRVSHNRNVEIVK